jgi:hypothetical protein
MALDEWIQRRKANCDCGEPGRPDLWIRSAVVLWCLTPNAKSQTSHPRLVCQCFFLDLIVILPAAAVASMHLKKAIASSWLTGP